MQDFQLTAGSALSIAVQLRDGQDRPIGIYNVMTPLSAVVWPGGRRSACFDVPAHWIDPDSGQVQLSILPTQTADLDSGRYFLELIVTDPTVGDKLAYQCSIQLADGPGTEADRPVYCELSDLETYAGGWLLELQGDNDLAGFARQRERARAWIDETISKQRGRSSATYIRQQLDKNGLNVTPLVVQIAAYKSLAFICAAQIGPNDSGKEYAQLGRWYSNEAAQLLKTLRAELNVNSNGYPAIVIDMGSFSLRDR